MNAGVLENVEKFLTCFPHDGEPRRVQDSMEGIPQGYWLAQVPPKVSVRKGM